MKYNPHTLKCTKSKLFPVNGNDSCLSLVNWLNIHHAICEGGITMRKMSCWILVLVLLLSLFAPALADTLPSAKFEKASRYKVVHYGDTVTWNLKLNSGSYSKVRSTTGNYIYRAGLILTVKREGQSSVIEDLDWSGSKAQRPVSVRVEEGAYKGSIFENPEQEEDENRIYAYTVVLTTYYRPTIGTKVYPWRKAMKQTATLLVYGDDE